MKYEYPGRSLYLKKSGDDVHILHDVLIYLGYTIPPEEYNSKIFGQKTHDAVSDIQKRYGRPEPYGVIDEQTAKLINTALEDLQPESYAVMGVIRYKNGPIARGLAVRAYDTDGTNEKQLGKEVLNSADGSYRIEYTVDQLIKPEKKSASLHVRAFRQGAQVTSEKKPNAAPLETVNLTIPEDAPEPEPEPEPYVVAGRVTYDDGRPFAGGLVHAFHEDKENNILIGLGEDTTGADGRYTIRYSKPPRLASINLRVAVMDSDGKILRQSDVIKGAGPFEMVDLIVPSQDQPEYIVKGIVRLSDGFPAAGLQVSAFDKDLRSEQMLGKSQTDKLGSYRIPYLSSQFIKAEKGSADLVIKVFASDDTMLAVSPVLFNAPSEAEVDITIPAEAQQPPTLFEKINQAIAPLLEDLKVDDLEENQDQQDISFLSGETGFKKEDLARFVLAFKLAKVGIRPEFWFVLLGGSFYQFREDKSLGEQLSAILDALPSLDAAAVNKALTRGFNEREIPDTFRASTDKWIEAFLEIIARRLVSPANAPTFVKQALEHSGIKDSMRQEKFAFLFNKYKALTPQLIDEMEKGGVFEKKEIADLQTSFQLAEMTQGDFSVVKMIKEEFDVRQPEQIRKLAKKSEGEWAKLLIDKYATGDIKLPFEVNQIFKANKIFEAGQISDKIKVSEAEIYGKMLGRQFRKAFPTAAFAGDLEKALQNDAVNGLSQAQKISKFLEGHEAFELLNTPVDDFLKNKIYPDFRGLEKDENFRQELKALQRVFKLVPTFEATDTLMADGLHSAQKIYRLGETEFVRSYSNRPGFTVESAHLAWNHAADTHAAALTIIADLKALGADALPQVLKNGNQALSSFPDWNDLFKAGDLCECEQCHSVLSPAAYFVDLLIFLKDRKAANPSFTVRDILFRRRPDLGYLELNCDNALVSLPYIDVVCEVLEDVIAEGENDLELSGFKSMPPDAASAKAAVAAAFASKNISLGKDFSLSQVKASDPDRWVVHGDDKTYLLKKKGTPNFFAEILRNTKASEAELRAYPEYVNPKAYNKLREAKYPQTLPFDLFAEEVRAAFQKASLRRWDLMRVLRGTATPNNPTDGQIASEYFGISTDAAAPMDEKRLILVADPTDAGQKEVWGETGANWLSKISNVKNFLQKTSLEYNDLLALLDLKFLNPTGDMIIDNLDPSCDTDKKIIKALDATKLDRMHRFLRMWRKLKGWKMWEFDLVLRHSQIGNGALDEAFLIRLFYFSLLRNKLGEKTTVEQVGALFGDLNTETHFTKLHKKREDALYQSLFLNRRLIKPLDAAFQLDPSTGDLPAGETIANHQSVILAALGIREPDLLILKSLTKASNNAPYINDDLKLTNLSFFWRHAWLSKLLKFKPEDWKVLLKILNQDLMAFVDPKAAWDFLEKIDYIKASGFSPDELNWLLAADRSAKAALKESDISRFLSSLRKDLQTIKAENDPAQYPFLTATPPTDVDSLTSLLTSQLQKLNRDDAETQFFIATLRNEVGQETAVANLPANFDFPKAIKDAISIRYHKPTSTLSFTGLMTTAERATLLNDPSLAAVTGIASYQAAIEELFNRPRLAMKFYNPVFTAPLANLPAEVDFRALPKASLSLKISYDAEQRSLRFTGIMLKDEKDALDALSADSSYRNAVNSLFTQPLLGAFPPERIWMQDGDLSLPLKNKLAENLATAIRRSLVYLSRTLSEGLVVQQSSAQLGLTEALTRYLLTHYALLPGTLLAYLTGTFADTTGVVDYATLKTAFDGWYWASRVATILKKWKTTLEELEKIVALTSAAKLIDFQTLPLDETGARASLDLFLRTSRLVRLRDNLPETRITLLEVLEKLNTAIYAAADFAADVELLNDAWLAPDVLSLTASLNLVYPTDYLLAESWERLRQAFDFLSNLNARADTAKIFAAATMSADHAKVLKDLLRSKFGIESWLILSAEIQDVLRERKRDALEAYLLAQPKPADAPSGKWEDTNDLYSYYLLDVDMSSCQLTSRLVQGSGSIQLFVQRCFMGLEPNVVVKADGDDGDSAWRWWTWMAKYQVWVANRKVFLWPENWIEPELKKDRSPFFKDMENELLQNDINQDTVETAFLNYLEKLDGVAQLEVAGFYQEDDGDNVIIHVFGRTKGAEPHLYYYRRYDYRLWTPWEKVDLDIQGDYLIPAVVNKRLFLFWPVFTEVSDEGGNSTAKIPAVNLGKEGTTTVKKAIKKLKLQIAVSEYRQGKWTPKKISKDFDMSSLYDAEIVEERYHFLPVDRSDVGGRFGIQYDGCSRTISSPITDADYVACLGRSFNLSGCKGVPELGLNLGDFKPAYVPEQESVGFDTLFMKWVELASRGDQPQDDFTLEFFNTSRNYSPTTILNQTPGIFKMTPPWQLSYSDKFLLDGIWANIPNIGGLSSFRALARREFFLPIGTWLPFFYNDRKRTFFVLPSFGISRIGFLALPEGNVRYYYPDIRKVFRQLEAFFEGLIQTFVDDFPLAILTPDQRNKLEQSLQQQFPEFEFPDEVPPPYTDDQVRDLIKRYLMRYVHYFLGLASLYLFQFRQFHFENDYHPFVCDFAKLIYNPLKGVPALMSRETQLKDTGFKFHQAYQPTTWVVDPTTEDFYPKEVVDFSPDGAYSPYNWELFFHAPLLIANSLSKNQRFEEARYWYHFIFNPLGVESPMPGGSSMSKYWITKPFFETTDPQYIQQRIDNILRMLAGDTSVPGYSAQAKKDLEDQVLDWRTNPFEPHRIAIYRTVAYQKTVVMKYLDNLIAWGDHLFQQDSMESINEATQLYIMAAEILGPRPKEIPPQAEPPLESFNELEDELDAFSNALVQVENLIPPMPGNGPGGSDPAPLPMLYFCIPENDKILGYWDTVADRLYKIRHCMNKEGVVRQLALFEPTIEPGALVKAIAGGMDLSSAFSDLNASLPLYRFSILLQKANEVCNDVKALGNALLSVLEKNDAEALGLLRQGEEIKLLEAVKELKEQQIDEAKENLEGLKRSKIVAEARRDYYRDIEKISQNENLNLTKLDGAHGSQQIAQGFAIAASIVNIIPNFSFGIAGFGGTPNVSASFGGSNLGSALQAFTAGFTYDSNAQTFEANRASITGGYDRRWNDWKLQEILANKEIDQIDSQISAAELRVTIAEKELDNQVIQIDNAKATDEFMRSKYTNQELYQWQIGQISGVYFQSYKLAYDLAKRAERCFRFETGVQDSRYINFGYWDSLKKGLLSGEKLQNDLRRLETAYLEQNKREFELTKHVSFALHDPLALVKLRETGRCFIQLPEEIFDLDYPGHYFRRIKSVSITLPCVVGPYTTISCTLRLLKNSIRINTANGDNGYPRNADDQGLPADDDRFIENNIPVKAIAASHGQNDSGVFELTFRDERYLPFEGAGAISEWSLELFNDLPSNNPDPANPDFGKPLRQFDYNTISDAVIHVKYTAREDAGIFKNSAVSHLRDYFSLDGATPSLRLLNLRQEFPSQWQRFLNPANPADGNMFELEMRPGLFLLRDEGKTLKINTIWLLARCTDLGNYSIVMVHPLPSTPPAGSDTLTLVPANQYGGLHFSSKDVAIEITPTDQPVKWQLKMTRPGGGNLQEGEVRDLLLVLGYEWGIS